jgi:hypothetical protein
MSTCSMSMMCLSVCVRSQRFGVEKSFLMTKWKAKEGKGRIILKRILKQGVRMRIGFNWVQDIVSGRCLYYWRLICSCYRRVGCFVQYLIFWSVVTAFKNSATCKAWKKGLKIIYSLPHCSHFLYIMNWPNLVIDPLCTNFTFCFTAQHCFKIWNVFFCSDVELKKSVTTNERCRTQCSHRTTVGIVKPSCPSSPPCTYCHLFLGHLCLVTSCLGWMNS